MSGVSVANQSDNRLITCTGTTDSLNGEANLTSDGTYLNLAHSGTPQILIGSTGGNGATLILDGDGNGDGAGNDYSYISMTTQGVLRIHNFKSEDLEFANGNTVRARFTSSGHFVPQADDTYNLGSTGARWSNLYLNDLQLSNESKKDTGGNDVDGTWGDYTIQEGESDLFLINNRNGKKYQFMLKEIS